MVAKIRLCPDSAYLCRLKSQNKRMFIVITLMLAGILAGWLLRERRIQVATLGSALAAWGLWKVVAGSGKEERHEG